MADPYLYAIGLMNNENSIEEHCSFWTNKENACRERDRLESKFPNSTFAIGKCYSETLKGLSDTDTIQVLKSSRIYNGRSINVYSVMKKILGENYKEGSRLEEWEINTSDPKINILKEGEEEC